MHLEIITTFLLRKQILVPAQRLETMVLMGLEMPLSAVRRQIASGIDILIHLGRLRDKSRRVLEICEVTGYDYTSGEITTSVLYSFLEEGKEIEGQVQGRLQKQNELLHIQKLVRAGIRRDEK